MSHSHILPTRRHLDRAISKGLTVMVDNLNDIKTCIYAAARKGDLNLFSTYLQQWDNFLSSYSSDMDKLEVVKVETNSPWLDNEVYFWDIALEPAGEGGNIDIINILTERGATKLFYCGIGAAKTGSIEIVKQLIQLGLTDLSEVSHTAALHGHFDLVKFLLDEYGEDFGVEVDELFIQACASGNMKLVKYLHENKTNDIGYGWAMEAAATSGNLDLLIWLEELNSIKEDVDEEQIWVDFETAFSGITPKILDQSLSNTLSKINIPDSATTLGGRWNTIMEEAAKMNRVNIIEYCLNKGANKFSKSIYAASLGGFVETVHWLIELAGEEKHNWEQYLEAAIKAENIELSKFFISHLLDTSNSSAVIRVLVDTNTKIYRSIDSRFLINLLDELHFSDWNLLLVAAAKAQNLPLVKLAIYKGANDFHTALNDAAPEDINVRNYLINKL